MPMTLPPLAVPSSLVRKIPVIPGELEEFSRLNNRVLPDGGVENEEDFLGGAGYFAGDYPFYFFQFVHQAGIGVNPAGRIDQEQVKAASLEGLDGVKDDGGGVGAVLAPDNRKIQPFSPYEQLLLGRRPESVGGDQLDLFAPGLEMEG